MTGNGTKESPYIAETFEELCEYIKIPGVYVKVAKATTFDLDEIYKNKDIPNGIQIGSRTELDGSGSSFVSTKLKAEDFDFEGTNAVITNFLTLPYKYSKQTKELYLTDDPADLLVYLSEKYKTQIEKRVKVTKKGLVVDLKDELKPRLIEVYNTIVQGNGVTISGHQDIRLYTNTIGSLNTNSDIYEMNFVECRIFDHSFGYTASNQSNYINVYNCDIRIYSSSYDTKALCEGFFNFYACNLTLYSDGNLQLFWQWGSNYSQGKSFFDNCNIYINNVQLLAYRFVQNCYIYGYGELPTSGGNNTYNNIFEVQTDNGTFTLSNGESTKNTVVNCSEGYANKTETRGITYLTTEEIRDPQKLYSAGIPIDPTGAAG